MEENSFKRAVDDSRYTIAGCSRFFDVPYANINNWYNGALPQKRNTTTMEKIMIELGEKKENRAPPILWICDARTN